MLAMRTHDENLGLEGVHMDLKTRRLGEQVRGPLLKSSPANVWGPTNSLLFLETWCRVALLPISDMDGGAEDLVPHRKGQASKVEINHTKELH